MVCCAFGKKQSAINITVQTVDSFSVQKKSRLKKMAQHVTQVSGNQNSNAGDFELIFSGKIEDFIPVCKYKSRRTGITIYIAQVDGPTVKGYLGLATEAHDDDGLPHTLEHLIFLGSEDYPYKGVLDMVANRCLASGTNAWTATDHTCYTVMTAGSEGFLNFLPAYLDHILYPTLSDAGFITEVHHVNGEGKDAGVVYCEMQGIENTGENLANTAMLHEMYPGHCGYKSETGGVMKNLRESTNNEKVCNFHKVFYRPENLSIIITGTVSAENVFHALQPIEDKILLKGPLTDFVKPWQEPVPPVLKSTEKTIQYPSDDVSNGLILISWRGPKAGERTNTIAIDVLLFYLTDTAISPIRRDLIEIEDPYCSKVDYTIVEYAEGRIDLAFENVPFDKLHLVKTKLFEVIKKIASEEEILDMKRMRSVINRKILSILSKLESSPHDYIVMRLLLDFLHGTSNKDFQEQLSNVTTLKELLKLEKGFWLNLLKKYFIDGHVICIVGEPSSLVMQKMTDEEGDRILKQQELLGAEGLKVKAEQLEKVIEHNDIPPPNEMIAAFKVPDISSIYFHPIERYTNYSELAQDRNSSFSLSGIPFKFQLDDIATNFVMLHVLLDTSSVPVELRLFLPLLLEVLLESPVERNGVIIPHDVFVKELAEDTVTTVATLGISCLESRYECFDYAQMAHFFLKVEMDKYARGVQLLYELIFCTQLTQEKIKIITTKMINDVSRCKRDGNFITKCLINEISFAKESNRIANNMMRQHSFLNLLLRNLDANPQVVIHLLEKLRSVLTLSKNVTIHMATDVKQLFSRFGNPAEPWNNYFSVLGSESKDKKSLNIQHCYQLQLPYTERVTLGAVVGVGSVESSFMCQHAPCISSLTHPDLPALMVFLQYLKQLEGPMWKQIRGLGLAYSYELSVTPNTGTISLFLYRCTHLVDAYKKAISILRNHVNGQVEWETSLIESARSSLMFELIQSLETVNALSVLSLIMHLNHLDCDYMKTLLKQVSEVTIGDLNRVGQLYIPTLFDPKNSCLAVCCHPSKVEEITTGFKGLSKDLTVISLDSGFMDKFDPGVFLPL